MCAGPTLLIHPPVLTLAVAAVKVNIGIHIVAPVKHQAVLIQEDPHLVPITRQECVAVPDGLTQAPVPVNIPAPTQAVPNLLPVMAVVHPDNTGMVAPVSRLQQAQRVENNKKQPVDQEAEPAVGMVTRAIVRDIIPQALRLPAHLRQQV